ncbi:leucine rich repeat and guanylate kinase domain containing [Turdus rufiventris]|nr:leucine rich repeat and guanylate kinase domain containing [Turdus rufiventris]
MAGGEKKGRACSHGEPLPPSDEPQGFPEEQPQLGPPRREEEQEEDGEEEESERSEDYLKGVLDEETAAEGLHTFGYSAPGTEYVYLHLSLPGRELSDISILSGYTHLQKMELCCNKINDNEIGEIRGLERCHSLTQLGLSHNKLTAIRGLEDLPITILNLSFNQIEKVDGLKNLKKLHRVDLSYNKINSLQGLEGHDVLEEINLEENQVAELWELEWIEDLPLLRVLNLLKNPIQEQRDYWLSAIFMLLQVTELDLRKVSVEEKVAAVNKQNPPPEVVAAMDHRTQVLFNISQPQTVLHSTLPGVDEPYPMLVLLGPLAAGKRELALKICSEFKNFFRFGQGTRPDMG